jgi:AraC-like DNA-binding protein
LYVLGTVLETRVLFSDDAPTPLGRVRLAGTLAASAGVRSRRLGGHAIVYVVEGGGRYADELGADVAVRAGDLILVAPGVRHSYGPPRGGAWDELYVAFDGPVFDLWRELGVLDPRRPVRRLEPVEHWLGRLRGFAERPQLATAGDREVHVCRFLLLLTAMLAADREPLTWAQRASALLRADPGGAVPLPEVAARLGMGYESFRKRFRRETGTSPAAFRAVSRLEVARDLLTATTMTNREIADSLGFADEYHFSKRYSRWAGIGPAAERRRAGGVGS